MQADGEDPELLKMAAFFASTSLKEMLQASLEVADELGLLRVGPLIAAAQEALEEELQRGRSSAPIN